MRPFQIASIVFYCAASAWTLFVGYRWTTAMDQFGHSLAANTKTGIDAIENAGIYGFGTTTAAVLFFGQWLIIFVPLLIAAILFGKLDKKRVHQPIPDR